MLRWFFYIIIVLPIGAFAQIKITLQENRNPIMPVKFKEYVASWTEADEEAKRIINALRSDCYLLANIDSVCRDSIRSEMKIYLFRGDKFFWSYLRKGNLDPAALASIGYGEKFYSHHVFQPEEVAKLMNRILSYYENNGYPFAVVQLDSVKIESGKIYANLLVNKNRYITIDSLIVVGDLSVSKKFLSRYLGIREKDAYNESAIRKISQRLRLLPFLTETKPVTVKLTERINRVVVFANKRNASQFDGIVGLLPSAGGKTIFTGDLKIKLVNSIFKSAETVELNWRRLQNETQDLKTKFIFPFVLNTPFGAEYNLKLYKRDSTFLDVINALSVNYFFNGMNNFKALYRQRNASVLTNSAYISSSNILDLADVTTRSYGMGFFYENLDYKLNPRKGISFLINGTAGIRQIKKNPNVSDDFYGALKLNSSQYQFEADFSSYFPIFKKAALKFGIQASSISSEQIFRNELFRIGGLKTLRGFDEESIYSSTYAIGTFEYRFLFEKNSSLFLFSDLCWYEKSDVAGYLTDIPVGLGTGINFETKAGIFSLTYALGNQFNNGFDVRSGKIHFGIVNSF